MKPERVRDALRGTGIVVKARMGGRIEEVLADLKRLAVPDLRLIVDIFRSEPDDERYRAIAERNYRLAGERLAELYGE